jgi:hypothetical protein
MDKVIDKRYGAKRDEIFSNPNSRENCNKDNTIYRSGTVGKTAYRTKPATVEARYFEGSYHGFSPRPIVEVIIFAMKPCEEKTYVDQALSNGKGVTWFDDCRIPFENGSSRLPANLLVSDNVLGDDSRYFSLDAWAKLNIADLPEEVQNNLPFLIVPRAEPEEKDYGLDQLGDKILAQSGGAQKAAKMGKEKYQQKNTGLNRIKKVKNNHPTVKPIKLMSYLITMGSREGDVVLDPFCGSGTTCIAAKMLKRHYIGIELNPNYREIAIKRIDSYEPSDDEPKKGSAIIKPLIQTIKTIVDAQTNKNPFGAQIAMEYYLKKADEIEKNGGAVNDNKGKGQALSHDLMDFFHSQTKQLVKLTNNGGKNSKNTVEIRIANPSEFAGLCMAIIKLVNSVSPETEKGEKIEKANMAPAMIEKYGEVLIKMLRLQ